jgi:ribosomal protein S27E
MEEGSACRRFVYQKFNTGMGTGPLRWGSSVGTGGRRLSKSEHIERRVRGCFLCVKCVECAHRFLRRSQTSISLIWASDDIIEPASIFDRFILSMVWSRQFHGWLDVGCGRVGGCWDEVRVRIGRAAVGVAGGGSLGLVRVPSLGEPVDMDEDGCGEGGALAALCF